MVIYKISFSAESMNLNLSFFDIQDLICDLIFSSLSLKLITRTTVKHNLVTLSMKAIFIIHYKGILKAL